MQRSRAYNFQMPARLVGRMAARWRRAASFEVQLEANYTSHTERGSARARARISFPPSQFRRAAGTLSLALTSGWCSTRKIILLSLPRSPLASLSIKTPNYPRPGKSPRNIVASSGLWLNDAWLTLVTCEGELCMHHHHYPLIKDSWLAGWGVLFLLPFPFYGSWSDAISRWSLNLTSFIDNFLLHKVKRLGLSTRGDSTILTLTP